ncbi:MAG: KEOPS complex kinase/ATPase Bud32 [Nitrososphaerales archaeon]
MRFPDGTEVKIGAEATIKLIEWDQAPAISKRRNPKRYRDPKLDQVLRSRRTKQEAEMMHESKRCGVTSPFIYFVNPKSSEIIMEYIEGPHLKDLNKPENVVESKALFAKLGENCARLHSKGIIHGDLTTKNVIVNTERLVLIDFGLSFFSDRLEDKAEDLHLLKQAIKSSCDSKLAAMLYKSSISGYESLAGKDNMYEVLEKIVEIEERGRYAKVD